ncbi:MAG: pyruvate:ferredoxin (flavodoxin) oxidoreductase [Leptospirales bacterium]|nr:pyruvate:ferredoxin (flavodoxin) oxidoreductase [Leptospirales bacterium]
MQSSARLILDGNEACARVAYFLNDVIAIYPITPASPMGEYADAWSAEGKRNYAGLSPQIVELQSEGGAAGALHGSLQSGALSTTFTASQGLLLMIPNMYKIAGELTPAVIHVASRALATHALSIFGDHSDVMAARGAGWGMLFAATVQEAQDFAFIAQMASLRSRLPFLHVFDGFRTSHEIRAIVELSEAEMLDLLDRDAIEAFRQRALRPEAPLLRGSAQNPDVFFQSRERANLEYDAASKIVRQCMQEFGNRTGRRYDIFEYHGHPQADRVVVLMGSGAPTMRATVDRLNAEGQRLGVLSVRLFRPLDQAALIAALPASVQAIAVLDRCKEPGAAGEPLYQDLLAALARERAGQTSPQIVGGRYGLGSREFTPAMGRAIFEMLQQPAIKRSFTVGIRDDISGLSLDYDANWNLELPQSFRGMFFGLGADGTVGANKSSIKILGDATDLQVQGYFVYDSKKSGSSTISHLRASPQPIDTACLIEKANFIACHHFPLLVRYDVLSAAEEGAIFLVNAPCTAEELWQRLPLAVQHQILDKKLKLYSVNASAIARELGLGSRINTIMQAAFFQLSGLLPMEQAMAAMRHSVEKTYGKRGDVVVQKNLAALDRALAALQMAPIGAPASVAEGATLEEDRPAFVRQFTEALLAGRGEQLPVSAMPLDGTFPTATARYEKRRIAQELPVWDEKVCIQCGKCTLVCPHSVIRMKAYEATELAAAPPGFKSAPARVRDWSSRQLTIQVAPEDCTSCTLCVEVCPARNKERSGQKALYMQPAEPIVEAEQRSWDFFLSLPELPRDQVRHDQVKGSQFLQPLFEFSGACAGCGETPYIKLATQLFGDRMIVANATGCSSIYGGNLPTTPWSKNAAGRGPAWSNSLFEDNAEFGLGMRLAINQRRRQAMQRLQELRASVGEGLADAILKAEELEEPEVFEQRQRVTELKRILQGLDMPQARALLAEADNLCRQSVWIIGGDGWGYDIGYGGLDHVLASGQDVNVLLLDTEVYSNTGGQTSKATPLGAVAKFSASGKEAPKKDLALLAMEYGRVYVARVAMGADDSQTVRAFAEAERYRGPSLIIAYSHCIAHGYDLKRGLSQQRLAVESGYWPLFRYHPEKTGPERMQLDSKAPSIRLRDYMYNEMRFAMLLRSNPTRARSLLKLAEEQLQQQWRKYEALADSAARLSVEERHG